MAANINLMKEPELPAPHEKLLRAPTFFEKYGWLKWFLLVLIAVGVLDFIILQTLKSESDKELPPPVETSLSPVPTIDITQNWKMYTNAAGKFSFKYPTEYTLTENVSKNSVQLVSNTLSETNDFVLTIAFKPITGNPSMQTLINQNPVCPKINSEKPISSVINGQQPAQLYVDTTCGTEPTSVIYTVHENVLYIMTVQTGTSFADVKPYTDQILSTLKLGEQTTGSEPENKQVMCMQDAMQCADGSWVGRTGPKCEFVCPSNNSMKKQSDTNY